MIWIDYAIIALISLYAFTGLIRGFTTEALVLVSWILAFAVGLIFCQGFSIQLRSIVANVPLRMAISFLLLFLLTLIVARLFRSILRQWVAATGVGGSERLMGLICGSVRGLVLVTILVLFSGLTSLPTTSWWHKSDLIPPFQTAVLWLKGRIPYGIAGKLNYPH
ncbi:MAG: CvpA family protein [Methylococcales bacterium]